MSSSPTAPSHASTATPKQTSQPSTSRPELLELLATIPDTRDARGRRHTLAAVLTLGLAAVLTGARSFVAIGEWARAQPRETLTRCGVHPDRPAPDTSTFRRVFATANADHLDHVIGAYLWTRTHHDNDGRRVIALDGKTVRGARSETTAAPHLVAAFDHDSGTVLGQLSVAAKTNEIPTVRALLGLFDLDHVVVTLDAMHTQTDTANLITDAGGDYVFTIKKNQPTLYSACKNLPWSKVPLHRGTDTRRGRRVTRTIRVLSAPAWIEFPGAAQIAQIRRTVTIKGKKTSETVYVVTSADHRTASPPTLADWVLGHWGIENRLHWVRDVTFDEDRSQVRTRHAPRVMATLRNTAISLLRLDGWSNIAAGLRHHARTSGAATALVLTCANATLP